MSAETDIRDWAVTQVAALDGVAQAHAWADMSAPPQFPEAAVHMAAVTRGAPNYPMFHADLTVMIRRHLDDDVAGGTFDTAVGAVTDWLQTLDVAVVQAATTAATVDGLVMQDPMDASPAGERHLAWVGAVRVFYTRHPASGPPQGPHGDEVFPSPTLTPSEG